MSAQRPLELILARNLLASISTPAFLTAERGELLFFNDAAAAMLGRRFEEKGVMAPQDWIAEFGPYGSDEKPIPYDLIPATASLRNNQPFHGNFRICAAGGIRQDVAVTAIPIVGSRGSSGAIVIFWPLDSDQQGERE